MGSKFKYRDGKVLGTQPHPLVGRLLLIVFYVLISLKTYFNIVILNSHTHTSIHLNIQHDISSQTLTYIYHSSHIIINPSIHLSHHIQGRKQIMVESKNYWKASWTSRTQTYSKFTYHIHQI